MSTFHMENWPLRSVGAADNSKMDAYESVLLVKSEVFVFKIPPRATNRGYRASDWNLTEPEWTGRMRLVAIGKDCILKLEDKMTGELFAKCPIEAYPGVAIEAVADSSRYFVLRIQDDNGSGRSAFIGVGFSDRSDSFDMNVALQDHFKWLRKSEEIEKEKDGPKKEELDLSFKEGETIKINMKITKKDGSEFSSRPKGKPTGLGLPPPPGGVKIAPPPAASPSHAPSQSGSADLLGTGNWAPPPAAAGRGDWGEFNSAEQQQQPPQPQPSSSPSNASWVQF